MKWRQKYKGILVEVISVLFILLFVYAGTTKLMEGHMFYDNIRNSPILGGETMASIGSWFIPLSELTVALLIAWRRTRLIGLYGALGLMLLFTGYTAAILFLASYVPCSCGGVITLLTWEQHFVFNIIFLLMAIWGIALSLKEQKRYKKIEGVGI